MPSTRSPRFAARWPAGAGGFGERGQRSCCDGTFVLALGLAVVGEVIARLAGSETHPLWAFAGAAVAVAGALIALAAPITDATVAEMLDRGLGLFDRVGTGLELEARTKGSPILAGYVVAEARGTLRSSFETARAHSRPAQRRVARSAGAGPLAGAAGGASQLRSRAVGSCAAQPSRSQLDHRKSYPASRLRGSACRANDIITAFPLALGSTTSSLSHRWRCRRQASRRARASETASTATEEGRPAATRSQRRAFQKQPAHS